jgi:sugar lactone lactonase YvrE
MSRFTMRAVTASAVAAAVLVTAAPAHADRQEFQIVLPGAISAEGIASGSGSTFYASDLFSGDIFRGDVRQGVAEKFIDNPPGRNALGLRVDVADRLLFAAGGFDGKGYVYDSNTGATLVSYQFSEAPSLINDVALTPAGAWFTNSSQPELYFVPITNGHPGEFTTLHLSGPAAVVQPDGINNNGIQATSDGSTLVVSHSSSGALNVVNPKTGTSRTIDDLSLPNVDGILMEGRTLYAAQTFQNRVAEVRLSGDLTSGSVRKVITSSLFEVPTTVARFGDRLAAVNAKFDTGLPPDATSFEVVVVDR